LEVFEERYLIMMANLLKTVQARFEVVLIERGHQLGAARRCPEKDRPTEQSAGMASARRHAPGTAWAHMA
jgi:Lon protease-like protein